MKSSYLQFLESLKIYSCDEDAIADGLREGDFYKLSFNNFYELPEGFVKRVA